MEVGNQQPIFRRAGEFLIDGERYIEVTVDEKRMMCRGTGWTKFELVLSFIGGALMEKQRRLNDWVGIVGLVMAVVGCMDIWIFGGVVPVFWSVLVFGMVPLAAGSVLTAIWMILKRESLLVYTPFKTFKIVGSTESIDELWRSIRLVLS